MLLSKTFQAKRGLMSHQCIYSLFAKVEMLYSNSMEQEYFFFILMGLFSFRLPAHYHVSLTICLYPLTLSDRAVHRESETAL